MKTTTMKAIGLHQYLPITHEESLLDLTMQKPEPTGRDILVQVKAISVNPVDVKVRSPKPNVEDSPKVLGWDVAGIVEQVGADCTLFQPGDEVYYAGSITRQGGNSEFHLVDERIVGKKPARLSFAEAAALPLTAITAWEAMFHRMGIAMNHQENRGKSILIIGAAGGVGSIAIQLAKYVGLTVIGTASRAESIAWIKQLGADHVINHFEPFHAQLKHIGLDHVSYIFCLNNTDSHWSHMAEAIAPQGKICSIVETKQPLDLNVIRKKSVTFVWELMFTRPMYGTEDMDQQHLLLNELAKLIDGGLVISTMTERLEPIHAANLRFAHAKIEQGHMIGKLVIENFS
jgi:NADPH2:quinone reductase